MDKIKLLKQLTYSVLIFIVLFCSIFLISGKFGLSIVRALVVRSGSMEPGIHSQSIVIISPVKRYMVNDVITFKQSGRDNVLVTHRVINISGDIGNIEYITKGDANKDADLEKVPERYVLGKVFLSIPYLGSVISYAQTPVGFMALIILPSAVIIYSEMINIKNEVQNMFEKNRKIRLLHPFK